MGGRKVCFIDDDGQVATCIKEIRDESTDCWACDHKPADYYDRFFDPPV
jgi:hypothetical protein